MWAKLAPHLQLQQMTARLVDATVPWLLLYMLKPILLHLGGTEESAWVHYQLRAVCAGQPALCSSC